jgi:Transposase IS116/IS110/IS902 family
MIHQSPTVVDLTAHCFLSAGESCGIAVVTSLAFVPATRVARFHRSKKIASYLGLNPGEKSGGGRRRLAAINDLTTRQSPAASPFEGVHSLMSGVCCFSSGDWFTAVSIPWIRLHTFAFGIT